jgi:hypothetical protein
MVQGAPDDHQVTNAHWNKPVLDVANGRARAQVKYFKVSVAVHANLLLAVLSQEYDVHRTGHVKRPHVNSFGINLRLDEAKVIRA